MKKFKRCYVEITNVCNLNCSFCDKHTRANAFMNLNNFNTVVKCVKNVVTEIYLHLMGEPLMHPELNQMLDVCDNNNLNVKLTTNARLLEKNLKTLLNHKCIKQINISLHSFLQDYVSEQELNSLFDCVNQIAQSKKVCVLRVWNGDNNAYQLNLINKHLNVNVNDLVKNSTEKQKSKHQQNIKIKSYLFVSFDDVFNWPSLNKQSKKENNTNCYALKTHFGILADGTVVPCCLDNNGVINLGNIFESDLDTILNSPRAKELVNGFNKGICTEELCKKCGYRHNHF